MSVKQMNRVGIAVAAAAALASGEIAKAAPYYYGGYDGTNTGTPDHPVSGSTKAAGGNTWYSDAAGTTGYGTNTDFTNSNLNELYFGGAVDATNYTATIPSSTTTANVIVFTSVNPGTNTLNFASTGSNRLALATPNPAQTYGASLQLQGSSNWNLTNTGSGTAVIRFSNSFTIGGNGTGTLFIPIELANTSTGINSGVNLTGGGTVQLGGPNIFGAASGTAFTLTNGNLDFTNKMALGAATNQVRLNGGTIYSSNGTSLSTYSGTGAAVPGGILIGGNVTFGGGTTSWSLGSSSVTLSGTRTLTANNTGTTGTTIGGVISESTPGFGLTVGASSTGKLTLIGANSYTGTTTVAGGTLQVKTTSTGTSAASPLLTGAGGVDLQKGTLIFDYTGDTSPAAAIQTALFNETTAATAASTTPLLTGQIRSTTATAGRGIGYVDNATATTPSSTVTLMPTLYGDADLDGGVSINDFNLLAANFGQTGKVWSQGDFDYDGGVSINDFNLLAANFGKTLASSSDGPNLAALSMWNFAVEHNDQAAFIAATGVPEPTTLGLLAVGLFVAGRRRR